MLWHIQYFVQLTDIVLLWKIVMTVQYLHILADTCLQMIHDFKR